MELFVDASFGSLLKNGEELCGDKVEFVRKEDYFLAVLADGLGSGVKANILATLTSKIIATMLSEGAQLTEAIETIASTLPVCKDRGIAYSTFTVVQVDRSGKATAAEFDNPNLVFISDGQLRDIQRQEQLIGGKSVFISNFSVKPGDKLVLFSDGVVHAGVGRLLDLGWQYDNIVKYIEENLLNEASPALLTKKLLGAVDTLYMNKPGDDSTVCTLAIKQAQSAMVMVGPPVNAEDDEKVVGKLMNSHGLKIVCGGTTSQIVSRVTGRELNVSLDYENPAIPPTATIRGVDLITEGVLTLGKAVDVLKAMEESNASGIPQSYDPNKKDGATLFIKMLIEDCIRITFLVGRALNPAHQNPGMPVSLGVKLTIIKELAELLKRRGKDVTVEYY